MSPPIPERVAAVAVAVTTPIVIVAIAVLLFLNPIWVAFEQDRSDVTAWTGYTSAQVHQVTGSILSDLVFGPPTFDATVNGQPVLDGRERGHMADVRSVFASLGLLGLAAGIVLLLLGLASRGRRWFWQAAAAGATGLAIGVVVVGVGLTLFFDQVFLLFHELFFPPGSFMFDPTTEKLVQLFPDQFWAETSVALAVVVLLASIATRMGARRLVLARGRDQAAPDPETVR